MNARASQPSHEVSVEKDIPVEMRDGTLLATDVYRPARDGRLTHVICRFHEVKDLLIITVYALEVE